MKEFKVGQVYTIRFFDNKVDFTITKINSKGITLKNELTRIELKDYKDGEKVVDVFKNDLGYYSWIMKGDFPEYTKKIFTQLKLSLINSK